MSEVGDGWMLVEEGTVRFGDQVRVCGEWKNLGLRDQGHRVNLFSRPIRRRVPAATADAPTPEPLAEPFTEPLAWGVQFIETGFLLGHYEERYEAEAVCRATNNGESECQYGPVAVVALYAALPTLHPWWRDVDRDEAIRAEEDVRAVTLPEWRELPRLVAELLARVAELERQVSGEVGRG
jgi:hypothetical protein